MTHFHFLCSNYRRVAFIVAMYTILIYTTVTQSLLFSLLFAIQGVPNAKQFSHELQSANRRAAKYFVMRRFGAGNVFRSSESNPESIHGTL